MKKIEYRDAFNAYDGGLLGSGEGCYLDSAATAQQMRCGLQAEWHMRTQANTNILRGTYRLAAQSFELYEKALQCIGDFLGKDAGELSFFQNATHASNVLALGLEKSIKDSGKKILLTNLEHHSNYLPWVELATRCGVQVDIVSVLSDGFLDIQRLCEHIERGDYVLCALTGQSNVTGQVLDLKSVYDCAKQFGTWLLVDGCQAVAHVDKRAWNHCDALFFSAHKLYGSQGLGVLWCSRAVSNKIKPALFGGGMVYDSTVRPVKYVPGLAGLQAGTIHAAAIVGLGAVCRQLDDWGYEQLQQHEKALYDQLLQGLKSIDAVKIVGRGGQEHQSIVSFNVQGWHAHDAATFLDAKGVYVRAGHHCAQPLMKHLGVDSCLRASIGLYNTGEDVDRILEAVRAMSAKRSAYV